MKILALFLSVLVLSSLAMSKKALKSNTQNKEGTVSNTSTESSTVAETHGLASNQGYILQSTAVFTLYNPRGLNHLKS